MTGDKDGTLTGWRGGSRVTSGERCRKLRMEWEDGSKAEFEKAPNGTWYWQSQPFGPGEVAEWLAEQIDFDSSDRGSRSNRR